MIRGDSDVGFVKLALYPQTNPASEYRGEEKEHRIVKVIGHIMRTE